MKGLYKPVAAATIRAFNAGTGYERSVASDDSGRYGLPLLPPGEYVVFVEAAGLPAMSRTGIVLRAGQVLTVEFLVPSSSFSESVQVTAEQPSIEVGRTVQTTITAANAAVLGIPSISIGAYTSTFRAHTVTARNDTQVSANHRLSFRYNYYHDRESPLNGGLLAREVSTRFDENPFSYTAQLVSVLSPRLVNEARFLYATRSISNGVSADPDAPNIDISGVGSFNGNANGTRKTKEKGTHLVDSLTWTAGRHVLKTGFDLLPVSFRERTTNVNGSFVFGGLSVPRASAAP